MRDLNGDNYGIINDNSITIIAHESYKNTVIHKEETTIKDIVKEKIIEFIVGAVLTALASLIKSGSENGLFAVFDFEASAGVLVMMVVIIGFGIMLCALALWDMIKLLELSNEGTFVEMESKWEWLRRIIGLIPVMSEETQVRIRGTGKCYKNIDGTIYEIIRKECPLCETKPIGDMHLIYEYDTNQYHWRCNQNHMHKIEFDYKKKM